MLRIAGKWSLSAFDEAPGAEPDRAVVGGLRDLARIMAAFETALEETESGVPRDLDPVDLEKATTLELRNQSEEVWNQLEVGPELGRGANGRVVLARDPSLDREVALKLIPIDDLGSDAERQNAVKEGRLLARVQHPNVVTVYGSAVEGGLYGLWMEPIRGVDLEQLVEQRGALGASEAALIGAEIARGAAAIHSHGILHRDIKAANVMRAEGGRIVLMDLGIGQMQGDVSGEAIRCTPIYYAAPEILRGGPASAASDIYSLGVLLFFLVSGEYPFTAVDLDGLKAVQLEKRMESLRDIRPDLSRTFVAVVERALAVEPASRFRTMGRA